MEPTKHWKVVSKTPLTKTGKRAWDMFDDLQELQHVNKNIYEWQIKEIRFWYGNYATKVVNGIQVTYQNLNTWEEYKTSRRIGPHALISTPKDVHLDKNENIQSVEARTGDVIDQLKFYTSKKRTILQGGGGGNPSPFMLEEDVGIIGFYGGTGDCLQALGFYVAPIKELRYQQKRPYIHLKAQLLNVEGLKKELEKLLKSKESMSAEIVFALLSTQGTQLFARVMKFI